MSVRVTSWVFESAPLSNDSAGMLVLLAIADHCADDGTGAYPSITRLCKKTRLSERTVQRALSRLERSGVLTIARAKGPHGTHLFTVHFTPVTVTPRQSGTPSSCPPLPVTVTPPGVSDCRERGVTVTPDPSVIRKKNHQKNHHCDRARVSEPPIVDPPDPDEPVSAEPPRWSASRRAESLMSGEGYHRRNCPPWALPACEGGICVPRYLWPQWERRRGTEARDVWHTRLEAFVVDVMRQTPPGAGDRAEVFWPAHFERVFGTTVTAKPTRLSPVQVTLQTLRQGGAPAGAGS